ncbi:hypothetical protein [Candidatus Accumulibacter sp. ACC003]|nr:hypothetical protein [Candidatus Accumulibacter sp. ACC003]
MGDAQIGQLRQAREIVRHANDRLGDGEASEPGKGRSSQPSREWRQAGVC